MMSLIPCAENCVHQEDGYCFLDKSGKASCACLEGKSGCIYYDPIQKEACPESEKAQEKGDHPF